jgi:ABC-type antimicrobial peptide transport system permease subunit
MDGQEVVGRLNARALLTSTTFLVRNMYTHFGQRRTEIELRMALGAQPAGIVRLVFRRVGVFIVAGLAVGLAGSWWAARFIAPLLFQVEARDPMTFSIAGTSESPLCASVCCSSASRSTATYSQARRYPAVFETWITDSHDTAPIERFAQTSFDP